MSTRAGLPHAAAVLRANDRANSGAEGSVLVGRTAHIFLICGALCTRSRQHEPQCRLTEPGAVLRGMNADGEQAPFVQRRLCIRMRIAERTDRGRQDGDKFASAVDCLRRGPAGPGGPSSRNVELERYG